MPAAVTNSEPVSAVSSFALADNGSVPSDGSSLPRLMLTTLALTSRAAHSMPARIALSRHQVPSQTRPTARFAPFATPEYFTPRPAIVEATCVPWPMSSWMPAGVKSFATDTTPASSGWFWSYPVSSTATVTPVPSYPACHAAGAPTIGTLWSREIFALPFNHSFPAARAFARLFQRCPASFFGTAEAARKPLSSTGIWSILSSV